MTDTAKTATCTTPENPAETMRDVMADLGHHDTIEVPEGLDLTRPHLITLPGKRAVVDVTGYHQEAAEFLKPARRYGTARFADLDSLISWANRFKGETSALFASPDMKAPTLTCIADYHAGGPVDVTSQNGDSTARHCHHRGVYGFPLSDEWRAWMAVSGKAMEKDDLGEFIEAQARYIMDPTPAIIRGGQSGKNQSWENRLIETAAKIEGNYGQLAQLLAMSRQFQVHETSNLTVSTNRDTGESQIQFLNEHKGADGKPLNIPNLIIIAIPVFQNGAPYRMTVRFRYRKSGGQVKFILSVYNPERAFKAAFDEALAIASDATNLPLFLGAPEV